MLTALRNATGLKVLARISEKEEGPFTCAGCREDVVLAKGNIKAHHFRHKPPVSCRRGLGETAEHMACKQAIYDALSMTAEVQDLELERDFGASIADVYARIRGVPVAIEVQRSNLSVADITLRTRNYHRLGIYVLWIGLKRDILGSEKFSPTAWEKWLHAAYFGRVYYWDQGDWLQPVHFGAHKVEVPSTTWFEKGGIERSAGGYDRFSKRYKTPIGQKKVRIGEDFRAVAKAPWSGGTIHVPACRLYVDRNGK